MEKYFILNYENEPLCWDESILYFDTEDDAKDFIKSFLITMNRDVPETHDDYVTYEDYVEFFGTQIVSAELEGWEPPYVDATHKCVSVDEYGEEAMIDV